MRTRWAVLGPGAISGYFARALPRSRFGVLRGVGSSDASRAAAFAAQHGADVSGTYADILTRDDIDAVYIGTVHTTHAELAAAALAAGKAVLCEKPATPTADDTDRLLEAAASHGRPFLEAYKFRFGPCADRLSALITSRTIGEPLSVTAAFGFDAGARTGRLFDPKLAGGALLDAGCYPVAFAVGIAAAAGIALDPVVEDALGLVGDTGVDEEASTVVRFAGLEVSLRTSIVRGLPSGATITGSAGRIHVPNAWGSRIESARDLIVQVDGCEPQQITTHVVDPFAAEADAISLALAAGRIEIPEFEWALTRATARVLSDWREAL